MKEIETIIKNKIHNVRGKQVMLDFDLAELYGVETKKLNQAVKRNVERFPEDFIFELTDEEFQILRSQFVTSSSHGGRRYSYFAFTEHGVAMLSGVLRSKKAIEVNIQIMRAFVAMRNFLLNHKEVFNRLDIVERKQIEYQIETDKNFKEVFDLLQLKEPSQGIFFESQVFDAFLFVSDLVKKAKKSVVLFDNYIDENTLKLFSDKASGVSVRIYTRQVSEKLLLAVKKFNEQHTGLDVFEFKKSHDRFLIIDSELYHFGASLKDLGKKWFAFSKLDIKPEVLLSEVEE